jgi:rhodanese-related sulfurtransferase
MKKSKKSNLDEIILYFVLFALIVGVVAFAVVRKRHKSQKAREFIALQQQDSASPRPAAGPAAPAPSGGAPAKPGQTAVAAKAPECPAGITAPPIELSSKQARNLVRGGSALVLPEQAVSGCYTADQTFKIELVRKDGKSGMPFARIAIGKAVVAAVIVIELNQLPKETKAHLFRQDPAAFERTVVDIRHKLIAPQVVILKLKPAAAALETEAPIVPLSHPQAKTVSRAEVEELVKSGAVLIDARSKTFFAAGSLPGAKSAEIENYDKIAYSMVGPAKYLKLAGANRISEVAIPGRTFVVFSNGPFEFSSYNLVSALALTQHAQNLKWYREGVTGWNKESFETPETHPQLTAVSYSQLGPLMTKVAIIDTRRIRDYQKWHVRDAVSAPYKQVVDARGLPANKIPDPQPAALGAAGEGFVGDALRKLDPSVPVLVMGSGLYDWKAFKAAVVLAKTYRKQVYWFRGGADIYLRAHFSDPKQFPIERGKNMAEIERRQTMEIARKLRARPSPKKKK